ncbi:hypothetical protein [Lysobacter sp. A03]|uniref:hypothetical protein n=1 Tax=Lysobacter sp. A03 TaxID=1199154 RepID=UPI0005B6F496|nr:hypothetical protein [Lysobacter sp. A03]KIQ95963.1 hypothetical protein TI01_2526 [Lysobacter sp. A03]
MAQRLIDLTIAILASIVSFLLSWPYFRNFEYWAESHAMWLVYFVVGFLLAVYVFYVLLRITRTLFEHDALDRADTAAAAAAAVTDPGADAKRDTEARP